MDITLQLKVHLIWIGKINLRLFYYLLVIKKICLNLILKYGEIKIK